MRAEDAGRKSVGAARRVMVVRNGWRAGQVAYVRSIRRFRRHRRTCMEHVALPSHGRAQTRETSLKGRALWKWRPAANAIVSLRVSASVRVGPMARRGGLRHEVVDKCRRFGVNGDD